MGKVEEEGTVRGSRNGGAIKKGAPNQGKKLKLAAWNKGGSNQELKKKRNEIEILLQEQDLDCFGIMEANLRHDAEEDAVNIEGYKLVWDEGRENKVKQNSRVVMYIKEELSYEVVRKLMEGDLMPEIWVKLGHKGTRRTLVGMVHREHTPWKSKENSSKNQEERLKKWLEARRQVWTGNEEAYMMGDLNIDWIRQGDTRYRNAKMLNNLCDELQTSGWAQLVKSRTHQTNREGVVSESLLDHIWTNTPQKVARTGQEEVATSDHQLVWVERNTRQLVERVKRVQKRSRVNYRQEDLERMCKQEHWHYEGTEERSEGMLNARVERLEEKIQAILEKVASMKTKILKAREKPRWLTQEIHDKRREKIRLRKKASRTKTIDDEQEARRVRNESAKEIKTAKLEYLRKKLENLDKNSPDSWAAVGEYLGW